MANNFDLVETALELLTPQRERNNNTVQKFTPGGAVSVDGPIGSDTSYGNIGIGALDARLWGMFPQAGSASSEFSAYIMGLIIERAVSKLGNIADWTDAEIKAFQIAIAAHADQYISDTGVYDLIEQDPTNADFIEYVLEKKGQQMGVKPGALAAMVEAGKAAAAAQPKEGILDKVQAAADVIDATTTAVQDYIDENLSGVHEVIDEVYGKGQEFIDAIWDKVPNEIKAVWPNAGIVYNTSTQTVTGTWDFGTGTPPIMPGGGSGIVIGNVNPAGGLIVPQKSSAIIITTGSAIKDKIINAVLGQGKVDIGSIKDILLEKIAELTGIPTGVLKGTPTIEDLIKILTTAVTKSITDNPPVVRVTQGCHPADKQNCWTDLDGDCNCPPDPNTKEGCVGVWCTADDELDEGCYGTDTHCNPSKLQDKCDAKEVECAASGKVASDDCETCVDAPIDPALQACLDQECTGYDEATEECTGCPKTPLEECLDQKCTGYDETTDECTGCPKTPLEECLDQKCTGYDETTDECTGCECPKSCPDPDNQTQASFEDGCGCTDIDPCDNVEYATDNACECQEGYAENHPCECQDGYADDYPEECGAECDPEDVQACETQGLAIDPETCECIPDEECDPEAVQACETQGLAIDPETCECIPDEECDPEDVQACETQGLAIDPETCECIPDEECDPEAVQACEAKDLAIDPETCECIPDEECDPEAVQACEAKDLAIDPETCECIPDEECDPEAVQACEAKDLAIDPETCECIPDEGCPNECDPETETQNKYPNCECVPIDPEECDPEDVQACENQDLAIDPETCECIPDTPPPPTGCDNIEYAENNPCECQDGYAEANPEKCGIVTPTGCDNIEYAENNPCECQDGYAEANPEKCGIVTPTGCDNIEYAENNPCECQDGYAEANPEKCGTVIPPTGCDNIEYAENNPCECQDGYADDHPEECGTVIPPTGCDDVVYAALNKCECEDGYAEANPSECGILTPCQELEGECAKLDLCADCNTNECVQCGTGCTEAQQALCPDAQLDANCNCPTGCTEAQQALCPDAQLDANCNCPAGPITPSLPPFDLFNQPAGTPSQRTVTSTPPDLVDIDYLYDVGGKSIFPTNMDEFLAPDTEESVVTAAKGGIVEDDFVAALLDSLRGR